MKDAEITKRPFVKSAWFITLRIILGLILLWKGILFLKDTESLKLLIQETGIGTFSQEADLFSMLISILTLLCGIFIIIGLFTKVASIIQIPILLVAIFFVNIKNIERSEFELVLSIIVLILLILFAIRGGGIISADKHLNARKIRER